MSNPLITAAMIVRNEEKFLPACLQSLDGIIDDLVIVDTGSTDRTIEIAQQYHAKIIEIKWEDDFSAARNLALEHSQGAWILYIDADERISSVGREAFLSQLKDKQVGALTVRFRPSSNQTRYRETRIFRNRNDIRFTGAIHETHLPDLWQHLRVSGQKLEHADFSMDHVGYDGPQDHKYKRNLPLLKARLKKAPQHLYSWVHLGATYQGLGEDEKALMAWEEGINLVRKKSIPEAQDCLPFLALLHYNEKHNIAVPELLKEAMRRFPENLGVSWLNASQLIKSKRYNDALHILKPFSLIDSRHYVDLVYAYDKKLFSVWTHDALGLCYFHLKQFNKAVKHFEIAHNAEPSRERTAKLILAKGKLKSA